MIADTSSQKHNRSFINLVFSPGDLAATVSTPPGHIPVEVRLAGKGDWPNTTVAVSKAANSMTIFIQQLKYSIFKYVASCAGGSSFSLAFVEGRAFG